jgi:hypothetical protein
MQICRRPEIVHALLVNGIVAFLLAAMARRRIGWVELFAKPILFGKRSLMGIASAFASRELRRDKLGFGGQVAPPIL